MRYFETKQWFALPLKLRQRWWRETDYSRTEPSAELIAAVCVVLPEWKGRVV